MYLHHNLHKKTPKKRSCRELFFAGMAIAKSSCMKICRALFFLAVLLTGVCLPGVPVYAQDAAPSAVPPPEKFISLQKASPPGVKKHHSPPPPIRFFSAKPQMQARSSKKNPVAKPIAVLPLAPPASRAAPAAVPTPTDAQMSAQRAQQLLSIFSEAH
jgi:hypothetical protein